MNVSADVLAKAGVASAALWAGPLTAACQANGITTEARLAAFLGNVLHETSNLHSLVESLSYTPTALLNVFPSHFNVADAQRMGRTSAHAADEHAIGERIYGGRYGNGAEGTGDGFLYRGHGALQTTFKANYLALAHIMGWALPLEQLPAHLATPDGASMSAAVFWAHAGCNVLADQGRLQQARITVNGGTVGLWDAMTRCRQMTVLLGGEAGALTPA